MGMEATVLPEPKINGREGLIIRKKNPGCGVLIYLTELGKEKETYQNTVLKLTPFKGQITEEKLKHFIEVSETINELIQNKIYLINLKK
jgi:hypothetical protein